MFFVVVFCCCFFVCLFFLFFFVAVFFFSKKTFEKILSGIPSECQTVWTLIRPDGTSGLILVQTVCQCYQQTKMVDKEIKTIFR